MSSRARYLRVQQVLLVEDDPVFADQLQDALAACPGQWQIHACDTGSKALDLLEMPRFFMDLALVDLGLPDVSGIEVIRGARRRFESAPIMVVSTISAERTVLSAIRAGACGYVLKDASVQSIAEAIDDVMQGNFPISPALARYLFRLAGSPMRAAQHGLVDLTPKELETLQLISKGHSYKETAKLMGVAHSTVQSHIRSLYAKLDAHSQVQALGRARDIGLL